MTTLTTDPAAERERSAPAVPKPRLGEELPIFCERCGYSLNGLPQSRCDHCTILQFHCPECGHHQPINTLRPAFQRTLGRLRACALALIVFVKLNFFGWLLFAWFMMGAESAYEHDWDAAKTVVVNGQVVQKGDYRRIPMRMEPEVALAVSLLGFAFGAVARMLLLRWPRAYAVGLVLAVLVMGVIALGAHVNYAFDRDDYPVPPLTPSFLTVIGVAGAMVWLGATVVWPIWGGLVRVFLPRDIASAVLDWQRFRPARSSHLARE